MRLRELVTAAAGVGILGLVVSAGCQGKSASKIEESLNSIIEKQDSIISKLDALEGKIGKAGPAAKGGPRPGQPDPKAVYKVDVDDAHAKGPDDAKITIVEWSDFQ